MLNLCFGSDQTVYLFEIASFGILHSTVQLHSKECKAALHCFASTEVGAERQA